MDTPACHICDGSPATVEALDWSDDENDLVSVQVCGDCWKYSQGELEAALEAA